MANPSTASGGLQLYPITDDEEYKTIATMPGYLFASSGRVLFIRGLQPDDLRPTRNGTFRFDPRKLSRDRPGRLCKPFLYRGSLSVSVRANGKYTIRQLATLLAEAWVGPRPARRASAVLIDPSAALVPSNIRWLVPEKGARALQVERNVIRAKRNATIRDLHSHGLRDRDISRSLRVPASTVSSIIGTRRPAPRADKAEVFRLWNEGLRKVDIQRRLKIDESTVYRILKGCQSPRRQEPK